MAKFVDRKDVPVEQTWNLYDLFENDEAYEKGLSDWLKNVDEFANKYKGNIKTASDINNVLKDFCPIAEMADIIVHYASLAVEVDLTNNDNIKRDLQMQSKLANGYSKLSFMETEIVALSKETLEAAIKESEEFEPYLKKLLKNKDHILSTEVESVLSKLSPVLNSPIQNYSDIKFGDIVFPDFEVNGNKYEMDYNVFENHMEMESDNEVRRKAFDVFSAELERHKNATASVYNTQVQKDKLMATLRGYDSVFDMLLDKQDVTRDLYNRQIDLIMEKLAPAMRKYAMILKKIYGLDKMTTADLKVEVDPTYAPEISYEETEKYILEGLSVLGEDYQKILKSAFEDRWIDYSENKGKRTGAFCASPYGSHSYVLLSFNHMMGEVMTLAHELGHCGHFTIAGRNQNILNTECSMYFVESPSTTNEIIMENYLLKKAGDDKRKKRWILSQMISKTYYHNFVTHLLEAAYQREVYKIIDEGGSVQADQLTGIYMDVLKKFWGEDIEVLEGSGLTWMRQPHYYDGLYSYTYSAGLTIGTQMAKRIINEGDHIAKEWLKVLAQGGSKSPIELAQMVGVDITTEQPLLDTIDYISSIIDEIAELTDELEAENR